MREPAGSHCISVVLVTCRIFCNYSLPLLSSPPPPWIINNYYDVLQLGNQLRSYANPSNELELMTALLHVNFCSCSTASKLLPVIFISVLAAYCLTQYGVTSAQVKKTIQLMFADFRCKSRKRTQQQLEVEIENMGGHL